MQDSGFDEAVKGVDAIEHTASPFHFNVTEPDELIRPAVAGTRSVLESALKHGSSVKRVVVTSSVAAILEMVPDAPVFTENDWNNLSVQEIETKGKGASVPDMYRASKTLAERAAWAFVEENKGKIGFDLVVINPPMVMGPVLHEVDNPDNLNTSMLDWYRSVIKGARSNEELFTVRYVIQIARTIRTKRSWHVIVAPPGSMFVTSRRHISLLCKKRKQRGIA